jgi:opacity protein-like surface antigen
MLRNPHHAVRRILVCAALGLLLAVAAHAEITIGGYTQLRYNVWDNALNKPDEFDLRRVRLKAEGPLGKDGADFKLQIDLGKLDDPGGGHVTLKDAWVRQPLGAEWYARGGFSSAMFGYEVELSSSKRLPLERSYAENQLFPDERGLGVYFVRKAQGPSEPEAALGYTNGVHKWHETDKEDHALMARLNWALPRGGAAGISYMNATRTREVAAASAGASRDMDNSVFGVHARWNDKSGVNLQSEYYTGKLLGVAVDGLYTLAEYRPQASPTAYYYRYDQFDDGVVNHDLYKRNTLGVAHDLSAQQRMTLQWEGYKDGKGGDFSNIAAQWQFVY